MVDGHYSSPKPINSGVPQGSVLSPTLFLLFIDDLSKTNCPIHSYADDSTLHYSIYINRRLTLHELNDSRLEATECLATDLTIISDWGKRNLVSFNASTTQSRNLSTRHNLPNNYPLFFDNTQLSPSSTLNILGLSLTQNLNWKLHILSLTKSASSRLGVLYRLRQFFSPAQLLIHIQGPCPPSYGVCISCVGGGPLTQLSLTEWSLRLFVSSALLLLLIVFYLLNSAAMLPLFLSSIDIFMLTALLNLLTACLPSIPRPRCIRLSTHAHPYIVQTLYARVNQHLHSFIPHAGKLWNNLSFICISSCLRLEPLSRGGYQDTSPPEIDL